MKIQSLLLAFFSLFFIAAADEAQAGGFWQAQTNPKSSGDWGMSEVILGDKFAMLVTGSFERTQYLYVIARNKSGSFVLMPYAPADSYFKKGKEVLIKLKDPSEKGTLTEILAKTKAGIEIIGSPDGHGEKVEARKFAKSEHDLTEYFEPQPDPDNVDRPEPARVEPDGTSKKEPASRVKKFEVFVTAEVGDGPGSDWNFSRISINEKYAVLRVGSFESTDYLYTVTREGQGYVLKPIKTESQYFGVGQEIRIELVKPTTRKTLMKALLDKGQGLKIIGSPDNRGSDEKVFMTSAPFTNSRMPHCEPFLTGANKLPIPNDDAGGHLE